MAEGLQTKSPARSATIVSWYHVGSSERIRTIRTGLLASDAKRILDRFSMPSGVAMRALKLSAATVNRKVKQHKALAPDESERVIGLAKLIGQVDEMVKESGNHEGFDAEKWVSQWLREPVPALGGECPIDFLDTMEGQALVSRTLAQMQSGAYA